MSRLGKMPIPIEKGCEVSVSKENVVTTKGPKGTLELALPEGYRVVRENGFVMLERDEKVAKKGSFHGLYRSLLKNNIIGVTKGFELELNMVGVGYRAALKGDLLDLQVGFSHPTLLSIPKGLQVAVEKGTQIMIRGVDKQLVGHFGAKVRSIRPPEPYKGKGIHRRGEYVRRKVGKAKGK